MGLAVPGASKANQKVSIETPLRITSLCVGQIWDLNSTGIARRPDRVRIFSGADKVWAEWIAWTLEEAGLSRDHSSVGLSSRR